MDDLQEQAPGQPARRAALKLLDAVLRRGETLEQAENGALRGVELQPDRALARAIAGEVLRWLVDFDALIDSATSRALPIDAKPRMVLRMMLAQAIRLETPPHAVIATCLPLLTGGPRRLAHGVFSTLIKREASLPAAPSLPDNVHHRWGERAGAIAPGLADLPPLDLSLRDPAQTQDFVGLLEGTSLAPGHVRLKRGSSIENLRGFSQGEWWVQDFAASLPARLLGPGMVEGESKSVLDLAAAPGGKTLQLAAAGWDVTAVDISAKRLQLLKENCERTGLQAKIITANALEWKPKGAFDAILLDAPCTATGTCRRHPDVLHRIGPRQIAHMAQLQADLLARACEWLKPGGVLVYAVCSMEREESEDIAAACTLTPLPIADEELPEGLHPTSNGWLRTDPGMLGEAGGLDGFFIARFRA